MRKIEVAPRNSKDAAHSWCALALAALISLAFVPDSLAGESEAVAPLRRPPGLSGVPSADEADAAATDPGRAPGRAMKPGGDAMGSPALPGAQTHPDAKQSPGRMPSKPPTGLGLTTGIGASSMKPANEALKPAPKLELKEGNSDFTNWTAQTLVDASQITKPLHLRWKNPGWVAKEARWNLRRGGVSITSSQDGVLRSGSAGSVPAKGNFSFFNLTLESSTAGLPASQRYWVEVELLDENGQTVATTNSALIDYQKQLPGGNQTIQLDQISVVSVSPTSGNLTGSPSGAPAPVDSIEVQLFYDLNTEDEAVLKAYGRTAQDTSPNGSKHYVMYVEKGKGTGTQRVWWECRPGDGPNMAYTAIAYALYRRSDTSLLAEGRYELAAPVVFDCGSQITEGLPKIKLTNQALKTAALLNLNGEVSLQSLSPSGGSFLGMQNYPDWEPGNHFEITYQYDLADTALPARISQWAEDANGNVLPGNNWTFGFIHDNKGTVQTKMTLRCDGDYAKHVSRKISRIRYVVKNTDNDSKIVEATRPVNYTVTCPGQHLGRAIPTNLQQR